MKECAPYKNPSDKCEGLIGEMHDVIGNINVYNIYGPCIMAMDESARPSSLRAPLDAARAARFGDSGPNGCIDASAAKLYLDHPTVRKAIHVDVPQKNGEGHCCCGPAAGVCPIPPE